jgi:hypothetical protein
MVMETSAILENYSERSDNVDLTFEKEYIKMDDFDRDSLTSKK